MMLVVILICVLTTAVADKCNPYATIIETDTFYLTQPFRKNITIDLANYINSFPKLADSLKKFQSNFRSYTNISEIESFEPQALIPFTSELNAFVITEPQFGKDSFKQCDLNKGSLLKIDSSNRARAVEVMKANGIDKTPVHVFPYYSLLSLPTLEVLDSSLTMDEMSNAWRKSPPLLTNENVIEAGTDVAKTKILCVKTNNPWDLESGRKDWLKAAPQVKTAVKMLSNLKTTFELSSKALRTVPRITKQIAEAFKLSLPENFQQVLGFLDTFSKKSNWESVKKLDMFPTFVKAAMKLVRQFETNPLSITKLPNSKPKFSPNSINELNWQGLFGLDDATYGIIGPVLIEPNLAYAESESTVNPSHFEATISARVFNRFTDKVTIYAVKPNSVRNEVTTVKTILETPHLQLALMDEVKPLQCNWHETEQFKVCHKMPLNPVTNIPISNLKLCAEALMMPSFKGKFENCPRMHKATVPSVYRAECEPDGATTAIINSDSMVQLEFVCDGVKMPKRNITSFPTFIPTPCEVNIFEGSSSQLLLPQMQADFVQEQQVGSHESFEYPEPEINIKILIAICVGASAASAILIIVVTFVMYICCKKCCKRRQNDEENNVYQPEPAQYFQAIQMHEIPY